MSVVLAGEKMWSLYAPGCPQRGLLLKFVVAGARVCSVVNYQFSVCVWRTYLYNIWVTRRVPRTKTGEPTSPTRHCSTAESHILTVARTFQSFQSGAFKA